MEPVANRNQITLRGSLVSLPEYSHENHGKRFYRFLLEVPRLSGTVDTLPVITTEEVLQTLDLSAGERITVSGQVRSHNIHTQQRRHLLIFVYAAQLTAEDGEPVNEVIVEGPLCREPTYRKTPLGREICDVMLAVPRAFHRADYLPCILWGRTALEAAKLATAVACIKCTRIGGRAGIPDRATAESFMRTGEIDYTEIDQRTAFYGKGLQL